MIDSPGHEEHVAHVRQHGPAETDVVAPSGPDLDWRALAVEAVIAEHPSVWFQGRLYCNSCRARFWPTERPSEALWPCAPLRSIGVTMMHLPVHDHGSAT